MLQFITEVSGCPADKQVVKATELTIRGPFKSFGNLHIVHNIGLNAVAAPLDLHKVIL